MLTKALAHRKDTRNAPATFTHQHFRKVAEIVRTMPTRDCGKNQWGYVRAEIAEYFAESLAATNPNFDRARFLMACQSTEN